MRIHVIHENPAWLPPLAAAFDAAGLPWGDIFADAGTLDLAAVPQAGVYYNRMSASSHTRDHRHAVEYTQGLIAWLERHGARVVNGGRAIDFEISKIRQYAALELAGIRTPRTVMVVGKDRLVEAARSSFGTHPFILKPNRGGKGLGVQLFASADTLAGWLDSDAYEAPIDGVHLLQAYIKAPEPFITRMEFVGGRFLYAVRVDTSAGFELCPADVCAVDDLFCPAGPATVDRPKFQIAPAPEPALIRGFEGFLQSHGLEVAAIEFVRDEQGRAYAYDVNTNTNYNAEAEAAAGLSAARTGPGAIAAYLGEELGRLLSAAA